MRFPAENAVFWGGGGGHMARNRRRLREGFRSQASRTLAIWESDFDPSAGVICRCQTPAQHWMKILHPWVQELYPVSGLENLSGASRLLDCVNSSPPLILRKFQGFGGIWANSGNSGNFGKAQGNSVEFSGVLYGA